MFKFNFSEAELEGEDDLAIENGNIETRTAQSVVTRQKDTPTKPVESGESKFREIPLEELTQALPSIISYSPLIIPLSGQKLVFTENLSSDEYKQSSRSSIILLRRDLFDARYQLIAQDPVSASETTQDSSLPSGSTSSDLAFLDHPSDLIPGVYEGGLKTWECSLDLACYLASLESRSQNDISWFMGKRILEIGCGTAVPTLFILHRLFLQSSSVQRLPTEIVLQDYNDLVFRLVTFPNLFLTWYSSTLAEAYRMEHENDNNTSNGDTPVSFDISQPGELTIRPELISAFSACLKEQQINIRFIASSWQAFRHDRMFESPFDLTMTSETIYQVSSLPTLIELLRQASSKQSSGGLEDMAKKLSIASHEETAPLCLVAAKILYFGVGGGLVDFERAIDDYEGKAATVFQVDSGVGRRIVRVEWKPKDN